jgi:Protein of unknown function (DUF3379)
MNVPQPEKNGESALARLVEARRTTAVVRPRWASLAGSILAGVAVGAWLWSGGSRNPLSDDVLSHVEDETAALAAGDPTPAEEVARVLEQGGIRLQPAADAVTHARSCRFHGQTVPHLVFRTEAGLATLLVLRHERVDEAVDFKGGGFSGRILPSGPGSLAVVVTAGADLDQIAIRMQGSVEWLR